MPKSGPLLPQVSHLNEGDSFTPGEELHQCKSWNDERKVVSENLIFFGESASFFSYRSCAIYENFKNTWAWWPSEDVTWKLGFTLFFSSSFRPLSLPLHSSPFLPPPFPSSSLPFFSFHYGLTLWSFLSGMATYHQKQQARRRCSGHSPNLLNETN